MSLAAANVAGVLVDPTTPVLLNRPTLSVVRVRSLFEHGVWDLSPALTDTHSAGQQIHWSIYPATFRDCSKHYVFALVNVVDDAPRLNFARSKFPGIKTIWSDLPFLRVFLFWLVDRNVSALRDVTSDDLARYRKHLEDLEGVGTSWKRRAFLAVQRLHAYRSYLPEEHRLPAGRLWGGATAAELAADPGPNRNENRTPRIAPAVMEPLLSAAILTATTIAADLLPVAKRLVAMRAVAHQVAPPARRSTTRDGDRLAISFEQLEALLPALATAGLPIPTVPGAKGPVPDWAGLAVGGWLERGVFAQRRALDLLRECKLPRRVNHLRVTRFTEVEGERWRQEPMEADELVRMIRRVTTACFLVTAYLSGVRTGEALNLERGCIVRDHQLDLIFMTGIQMKSGDRARRREVGALPWVVVEPVAQAVAMLEALTQGTHLFTAGAVMSESWLYGSGRARTPGAINADISDFITWFNATIAPRIGHQPIPPDPEGRIVGPRLRRTLAWHIVRRPGGAVAGAVQYGHVRTQMTQGYAGRSDSGFVDEVAFEELLVRIETLAQDADLLDEGEHVSGPAANTYKARVATARTFAGLTVPSTAQERQLASTEALEVHHGDLFTCVWAPETAACVTSDDAADGPSLNRCKVGCSNLALTDRDASQAQVELTSLDDELATVELPNPLRTRLTGRRDLLAQRLEEHSKGRPTV